MKKTKNSASIYAKIGIIWLVFISAYCSMEPRSYPITIYNKTDHYINILLSHGDPSYPDTLLPDRYYDINMPVKSGNGRHYAPTLTYKNFVQQWGSDTVIIFIFHSDTLTKYTWKEVREGYKILKRYDVSWQEMEALKGEINYPPTEAEKGIRQYPPYE